MMEKKSEKGKLNLLRLLLFCVLLSCLLLHTSNGEKFDTVGYGCRVVSLGVDPSSGEKLITDLKLINESLVFGPDIESLALTVRALTSSSVHVVDDVLEHHREIKFCLKKKGSVSCDIIPYFPEDSLSRQLRHAGPENLGTVKPQSGDAIILVPARGDAQLECYV
ncbi:hypothetical protein LINPERHAP1_LOCUS28545 [Linum perenne]